MKNFKTRLIALTALLCVALSSFAGCSSNSDSDSSDSSPKTGSSDSSDEEPVVKSPFTWGSASDSSLSEPSTEEVSNAIDLDSDDPVKKDKVDPKKEVTTELVAVLDSNGEPVTEVVEATNNKGEKVTEAGGQPVTEVVPKVQVVEVTKASDEKSTGYVATGNVNGESDKTTKASTTDENKNSDNSDSNNNSSDYTPHTEGMYAMWIDISKNENFVFNDSFVKMSFKVKENTPDGTYNITIVPDLSSIAGVTITPDNVYSGAITVNGSAETVDVSGDSGFVIYGDKVSAKQGDTVDLCLKMKNNPGLAALCVWFYYDSNAFELVDCAPDGEFAEVAGNKTQIDKKGDL